MQVKQTFDIKAIIGLGNPGTQYANTRHNIGFGIVDALAQQYNGVWQKKDMMEIATIEVAGKKLLLIKPLTFMNSSGKVIPVLNKQGIKAENILVAHDELELPFGTIRIKQGGSSKGHNGLKSIIEQCGENFVRLRFGISRPENREDVPDYVLRPFNEPTQQRRILIEQAVQLIVSALPSL